MKIETPLIADVVLVGGGHAHVHSLKMFGMPPYKNMLKENGIRVTLISSCVLTPYSGMLPGFVAGHYEHEEIHLDLRKLCSFSGVRFIHAAADGITYENGGGGFVSCSNGRPDVRYDVISIDIGSNPSIPSKLLSRSNSVFVETNDVSVTPVKPIASFSERWQGICEKVQDMSLEDFSVTDPFKFLIVGGGAGGIELALSAQHALRRIVKSTIEKCLDIDNCVLLSEKIIEVSIATRGDDLLPSHNNSVRTIFRRILKERNIKLYIGADVIGVDQGDNGKKQLKLSSNSKSHEIISFDECLWCTSAGAPLWLRSSTPFETVAGGFISVNDTYESTSHPGVFAAGDCCHMVSNPRPKAGVFAVRAGPILTQNIISFMLKQPLTSHVPQKEFLGLISTGDKYAVASRGNHALEGEFLWRLKDEIDKSWMAMYQNLPSTDEIMDDDHASENKTLTVPPILQHGSYDNILSAFIEAPMRCGGCGSKVGSQTLTRVISAVHNRRVANCHNDDKKIINPIDPDDAAIVMIPSSQQAMVQTLDFFRSFISDPYVFGKIAAVHALSDCHAMGANAHTALALAVVNFSANELITETTLIDMLAGASDIFDDEGCEMSGGHTCEGLEQALGFSVTGFVSDPKLLLRKRGGRVGDKIVLTKPIGTGALFAADMRAKCRGEYVDEALHSMMFSNGAASRIARNYGSDVHACTDVTGFGLIGHLIEMLIANDNSDECHDMIRATIDVHAVPFLKGALEAAANGFFSSLQRENFRNRRAVQNHEEAANCNRIKYPLLFDPQTAGGLLLFVSPSVCEEFMNCLSENNIQNAAVIGELFHYDTTHAELFCDSTDNCIPITNRVFVKF